MSRLRRRDLSRPDETRSLPAGGLIKLFELGDSMAAYSSFEPGWRWSEHVKPIAGTEDCDFHHMGFSISGRVRVAHRDGAEIEIGPQQFFEIPPHHDAWVVGDEPWVSVDWGSGMSFGREAGTSGQRLVRTLLFTDIVDSTVTARKLGDIRWRDLLADHNRVVRMQLERFGGQEAATTGDGFVVLFESAERAVHAGWAITTAVSTLGIRVRCGIHTGELELEAGNVRGLAVHVASRVVALAGPDEVLVSWTTRELLTGSTVRFEDRGLHEMKGLPERKPVHLAHREALPPSV